MNILNSPLMIVLVIGIIVAVIFYRKFTGADRRCGECRSGLMTEIKATPEAFMGDTSAANTSKTTVLCKVTYKCSKCGGILVRTENRD